MKVTITYPESWADIKLSQYLRYYKVIKPYVDTEEYDKISLETAALHFCNVPAEHLYKLPESSLNKIKSTISNLTSTNKLPLVRKFTVDETTYGFIPELDSMAYGEYLDLVAYFKDTWDNLPIIFSILYRPVVRQLGNTYSISPYNGTEDSRIELFNHTLTMDVVFGAISFFLDLQIDLLNSTLVYSVETLKKSKDPQVLAALEDLEKNGTDITQLQSLLTTTLQNSIR